MSILLLGPLPPIRGGVAKHSQELFLALSRLTEIEALSPKKLYPDFLFPGREQLDNSIKSVSTKSISRVGWLHIVHKLLFQRPTVFVMVWWTHFFSPLSIFGAMVMRAKGVRCSVFCHNVVPHDAGKLSLFLTWATLRQFDHHIVQSEAESERLQLLIGKKANLVLPHPVMPALPTRDIESSGSNSTLTFLFIGLIRPYKGAPLAARAFTTLKGEHLRLRIVGECWDEKLRKELEFLSESDARITFVNEYVSEQQFIEEIASADFLLLPYTKVTGSQILATASGLGTPPIASDIPGFRNQVREGANGYLFESGSVVSLALAMDRAGTQAPVNEPIVVSQDWDTAAAVLLESLDVGC